MSGRPPGEGGVCVAEDEKERRVGGEAQRGENPNGRGFPPRAELH